MFQAVLEMSQHHYDKAEETLNKIIFESKSIDGSVLARSYLALVEITLALYRINGESREVFSLRLFVDSSGSSSAASPTSLKSNPSSTSFHFSTFFPCRDTIPPFIRNRISFHYHIDRTRYFLEQGSVKGVKKEVFPRVRSHAGQILERFLPRLRQRIGPGVSRRAAPALRVAQRALVVTSRRNPRRPPRFREPRLSSAHLEKPA